MERDIRKKVLAYNRDQFRQIRSQQRPFDLGFSQQQWFDPEEAFARVSEAASRDHPPVAIDITQPA